MQEQVINITDKALVKIKEILKDSQSLDSGIRIGVIGGGCSGLSYKIDMGIHKEKDFIQVHDSIKIFIDPKSSIYLKDVILDYTDGLNGKGFTFSNPNAKNTCGCGESFSI